MDPIKLSQPQYDFLSTEAEWAVFGGSAGGGKTFSQAAFCRAGPRLGRHALRARSERNATIHMFEETPQISRCSFKPG